MSAAGRLGNLAAVLGAALETWGGRDGGPGRRQTANEAMAVADDMITALYKVREQLAGEMRAYDDATAARVDKLLEERRARRDAAGR